MRCCYTISSYYILLANSALLISEAVNVAVVVNEQRDAEALEDMVTPFPGESEVGVQVEDEASQIIASSNTTAIKSPSVFVDLFGEKLMYLAPTDNGKSVQPLAISTTEALAGKNVVGVYFSADWCGPCRKFTPELVSFYKKINKRRKNDFEIVWVSRCRAVESHWEFFAHMGWMSIPPEEAMGNRGSNLSNGFKVKGIPTLVLLDSQGQVITLDGRNKIPQDRAGIGFPWRNPIANMYISLVPKSIRTLVKSKLAAVGQQLKAKFGQSMDAHHTAKVTA